MTVLLIVVALLAVLAFAAWRSPVVRRVLVFGTSLVVLAIAVMWGYDIYRRPHMVAHWLNLERAPESLSVVDCETAPVLTDVLSDCLIEIEPREFSDLLKGYDFSHQSVALSSVNLASGTRDFAATDLYSVTPKSFVHGGAVMVYANAQKNQAIVDLYIE